MNEIPRIQLMRGNTATNNLFVGRDGEITLNTDNYSLRVHDGETAGGHEIGGVDESKLNFLPKTGGALTGGITLQKTNVTKGTNPTSTQYWAIHCSDSSGGTNYTGRTHTVEASVQTNGNTTLQIRAYPWIADATNYDGSGLTVTATPAKVYSCSVTGSFTATADVVAYSDARLKENIETIPDALGKVMSIRGVTFTRNDLPDKETRHMGVIAQEVIEYVPEVVFEHEKVLTNEQIEAGVEPETYYGVSYGNITALLIEAVKEQQSIIKSLEERINILESK